MIRFFAEVCVSSLLLLLVAVPTFGQISVNTYVHGGIIRGDLRQPKIALVFTGHEYAEGGEMIVETLRDHGIRASFFFTGDFYRDIDFNNLIKSIKEQNHYLGAHSDRHLLYCDWEDRNRLLITKEAYRQDLAANYIEMQRFGIGEKEAKYYLPPYEWYNDSISRWTAEMGLHLVNFTPGTRSNADYTTPDMPNYLDSKSIFQHILAYEQQDPNGLNGFILLLHVGVGPKRADKFHRLLPQLLQTLKERHYTFVPIDELLNY